MGFPFVATFPKLTAAGVCALQTRVGAGALLLNGALSNAAILPGGTTFASVTLPLIQRTLSIFSTADLSSINFTFVGKDLQGVAVTEILAGPTANATVETTNTRCIESATTISGHANTKWDSSPVRWPTTSVKIFSRWIDETPIRLMPIFTFRTPAFSFENPCGRWSICSKSIFRTNAE